jgi:hypothetical protein
MVSISTYLLSLIIEFEVEAIADIVRRRKGSE